MLWLKECHRLHVNLYIAVVFAIRMITPLAPSVRADFRDVLGSSTGLLPAMWCAILFGIREHISWSNRDEGAWMDQVFPECVKLFVEQGPLLCAFPTIVHRSFLTSCWETCRSWQHSITSLRYTELDQGKKRLLWPTSLQMMVIEVNPPIK